MKKILIIGIIFILIGGAFCGAAYAVGEKYMNSKLTDVSQVFESDNVSKINIAENVANIKFFKSDNSTGDIVIRAENVVETEFKCSIENGNTLKISYNPNAIKFGFITFPSFIFDWKNKSPVINVYIPEDKIFEEVYFKGGIGNINAELINAKSLIIGGGVGNSDVKNMNVETLKIDGGLGNVTLEGTVNGNAKIDIGVGNVKISGQINGDIKLNAGMGNTTLDLTGNIGDYNIKANRGLGNINLNGSRMPDSIQNGGKYNLDIDAGVGNININIK